MHSRRILFLSECFGKGHLRVAQAMAKAVLQVDHQASCSIVNVSSEYMPKLFNIFNQAYLRSIKYSPSLYRKMYAKPNNSSFWSVITSSLGVIYLSAIKKIIREFRPDIIVCTHPFPAIVVGQMKANGLEIPMVIAVTDYGFNQSWFVKEAEQIIVATEEQRNLAYFLGIPYKQVLKLGIPIDPIFKETAEQSTKDTAKISLGLDPNIPLVLVMGGGLGLSLAEKELKSLLSSNRKIQLVIITGSNHNLKKSLEQQLVAGDEVKILGWVDNVYQFLLAADILISKPGGVTMAEALGMGVPILMTDPLPGQEEENMDYIMRHNAGIYFPQTSHEGLGTIVDKIFKKPHLLSHIGENAKDLGALDAAEAGAGLVLNLIDKKANLGGLSHGLSR